MICVKSNPIDVSKQIFLIGLAAVEPCELYEGTNNTPVNTCHLHIIIAANPPPFNFLKFPAQ